MTMTPDIFFVKWGPGDVGLWEEFERDLDLLIRNRLAETSHSTRMVFKDSIPSREATECLAIAADADSGGEDMG
jgi:hypothetical protein